MFFRQSSYFSPGNFSVSEIKRNNIQVAACGIQSLKMDDKIYIFNSSKGYEINGSQLIIDGIEAFDDDPRILQIIDQNGKDLRSGIKTIKLNDYIYKYKGEDICIVQGFIFIDHGKRSPEEAMVLPHRADPRLVSITDGTKNIVQTNDEVVIKSGHVTAILKNIKNKNLKMYKEGYIFLDDVPLSYKDSRLISCIDSNGKDLKAEYAKVDALESESKTSPAPGGRR